MKAEKKVRTNNSASMKEAKSQETRQERMQKASKTASKEESSETEASIRRK